jgi:hypothetical protein
MPTKLKRIISKERKATAFHKWHSVTDQKDNKTWGDKNDDGETKNILEFIGSGLNDVTLNGL